VIDDRSILQSARNFTESNYWLLGEVKTEVINLGLKADEQLDRFDTMVTHLEAIDATLSGTIADELALIRAGIEDQSLDLDQIVQELQGIAIALWEILEELTSPGSALATELVAIKNYLTNGSSSEVDSPGTLEDKSDIVDGLGEVPGVVSTADSAARSVVDSVETGVEDVKSAVADYKTPVASALGISIPYEVPSLGTVSIMGTSVSLDLPEWAIDFAGKFRTFALFLLQIGFAFSTVIMIKRSF